MAEGWQILRMRALTRVTVTALFLVLTQGAKSEEICPRNTYHDPVTGHCDDCRDYCDYPQFEDYARICSEKCPNYVSFTTPTSTPVVCLCNQKERRKRQSDECEKLCVANVADYVSFTTPTSTPVVCLCNQKERRKRQSDECEKLCAANVAERAGNRMGSDQITTIAIVSLVFAIPLVAIVAVLIYKAKQRKRYIAVNKDIENEMTQMKQEPAKPPAGDPLGFPRQEPAPSQVPRPYGPHQEPSDPVQETQPHSYPLASWQLISSQTEQTRVDNGLPGEQQQVRASQPNVQPTSELTPGPLQPAASNDNQVSVSLPASLSLEPRIHHLFKSNNTRTEANDSPNEHDHKSNGGGSPSPQMGFAELLSVNRMQYRTEDPASLCRIRNS